jgi:hypothetical protein
VYCQQARLALVPPCRGIFLAASLGAQDTAPRFSTVFTAPEFVGCFLGFTGQIFWNRDPCTELVQSEHSLGCAVSTKEFQEYADECMAWAKSAKTDKEREIYLQMAKAWSDAALIAREKHIPAFAKPPSDEATA